MKTKLYLIFYILFGFASGALLGAAASQESSSVKLVKKTYPYPGAEEAFGVCGPGVGEKELRSPFVCNRFETKTIAWEPRHVLSEDDFNYLMRYCRFRISTFIRYKENSEDVECCRRGAALQQFVNNYGDDLFDIRFWTLVVMRFAWEPVD